MDEPKQTPARATGYVMAVALALIAAGYVWTERGGAGVEYSRLLGFRIEGEPLQLRQVGGMVVLSLPLVVVALAAFRRSSPRGCAFVLGGAALLGVAEIVQAAAVGVFGEFVGVSIFLSGGGGLLLLVASLGAMDRIATPEIRGAEGGRA